MQIFNIRGQYSIHAGVDCRLKSQSSLTSLVILGKFLNSLCFIFSYVKLEWHCSIELYEIKYVYIEKEHVDQYHAHGKYHVSCTVW